MKSINSKTILFATGAFVGNNCWDEWRTYFESKGYKTLAPSWTPAKDGSPKTLRDAQPNAAIAAIRLNDVINTYAQAAQGLSEKPIVIGHSLGGLTTQILVNRGLAAAGVAIHSVPPQGIIPLYFSFFKATWKSLGVLTSLEEAYLMSLEDWQYAFTNGMSPAEQQAGYDTFCIPESKLAIRDGLTSDAHVDFDKAHAPLLFTAGEMDHCIPAALNHTNYEKYTDKNSVTDFKSFEGRNHFVLGQPTWREDADYILDWIESH